jgi:hypothetical protein
VMFQLDCACTGHTVENKQKQAVVGPKTLSSHGLILGQISIRNLGNIAPT